MKQPTNQTAEVLYELLTAKHRLSFSDIYARTGIINLTARISNLRRAGLNVFCLEIKTKNKHGRLVSYGTWSVSGERKKAREVYQKINLLAKKK